MPSKTYVDFPESHRTLPAGAQRLGDVAPDENMRGIDEAELRTGLSAAREARRRSLPIHAHLRSSAKQPNHIERALLSVLGAAGRDFPDFDEARLRADSEMRELIAKHRAAAKSRSSFVEATLRWDVESRRKMMEHFVSQKTKALSPGLNFNFVVLDTPAFVVPSQDIFLHPPHIEPWNNVARFYGEWASPHSYPSGYPDPLVSFAFAWRNPSDAAAVINVESALMFNGWCELYTENGWRFEFDFASTDIYADLVVYEWWNQPPTIPPFQPEQRQRVVSLYSASSLPWSYDSDVSSLSGYYDLRYQQFMLPPKGVVVFEVIVNMKFTFLDPMRGARYLLQLNCGQFDYPNFQVMCPAVVIAILT
jgi:hypothetical protein